MIPYLIALFVAAAGGLLAYYLIVYQQQSSEAKNVLPLLKKEIAKAGVKQFDIANFQKKHDLEAGTVSKAASSYWNSIVEKIEQEQVIKGKNEKLLAELANCLGYDLEKANRTILKIKKSFVSNEIRQVMKNWGESEDILSLIQTAYKKHHLNLQERCPLPSKEVSQFFTYFLNAELSKSGLKHFHFTKADNLADLLGINKKNAHKMINQSLVSTFQSYVKELIEQQMFGDSHLSDVITLSKNLNPVDCEASLQKYHLERELYNLQEGQLPSVRSALTLDGGEICHYENHVNYLDATTSSNKLPAKGRLTLTNRRVIFISNYGVQFEMSFSKIFQLHLENNVIAFSGSTKRSNGAFIDTHEVSARKLYLIMNSLIKKQKYILSEESPGERSRHIPGHVRQEVYTRDGGKCVQCGAEDYLEYDHIIPHSKGGANTVNNIQLLCRRCNGQKSNRVG